MILTPFYEWQMTFYENFMLNAFDKEPKVYTINQCEGSGRTTLLNTLAVQLFFNKNRSMLMGNNHHKMLMVVDTQKKLKYNKQEIIKHFQYIEKTDLVARKKIKLSCPDSYQAGHTELRTSDFFNFTTIYDLFQSVKNEKDLLSKFGYIFFDDSGLYDKKMFNEMSWMVNDAFYNNYLYND